MYFQKALSADYPGILELQNKNFINNLTESEKKDGFLSVEFTKEQFEIMNDQAGIVVCKDQGIIYGYLCASTPEFNRSFELPAAMIALYPRLSYQEKSLDQYRSIVAGPWCIERNSRGKGIFMNMWDALNKILTNDIELLTTFVSAHNLRSLYAAKKVGMEEIVTFEFRERKFCLLVKIKAKSRAPTQR